MNRRLRSSLTLILFFICTGFVTSLSGQALFEKTFGGPSFDAARDVMTLPDGSFVMIGYAHDGASFLGTTSKFSSDGNLLWTKSLADAVTAIFLNTIIPSNAGGFFVAGQIGGGPGQDMFVAKLDAVGDTIWTRRLGSNSVQDNAECIVETASGDIFVGGLYSGSQMGLVKLDASGNVIWANYYGWNGTSPANLQTIKGIGELNNGNIVITGTSGSFSSTRAVVALVNPVTGNLIDQRYIKVNGYPWDIAMTPAAPDQGFAITGGDDVNGSALYVMKLDNNLATTWTGTRGLGAGNNVRGRGLAATPDGGIVVVSETAPSGNAYLAKYSATGRFEWHREFGPAATIEEAVAVGIMPDSGYVVVGNTGSGLGGGDAYLVRTDSLGVIGGVACNESSPGAGSFMSTFNASTTLNGPFAWSPVVSSGFITGSFGTTSVLCQVPPLPVGLVRLNAHLTERQTAQIDWEIAEGGSLDRFEIEHSTDGESFEAFDQKIWDADEMRYSAEHPAPAAGTNYYRLRMVDQNGSAEYSGVVQIEMLGGGLTLNGVFPNPVARDLNVGLQLAGRGKVTFELRALTGQVMRTEVQELPAGMHEIQLDLSTEADGIYLLTISSNRHRSIRKIVKQH